jgi:hypothetical protein
MSLAGLEAISRTRRRRPVAIGDRSYTSSGWAVIK